jgi:DNA-binding winged helix-turn-helix (wHTH) protein
LNRYNSAVRFDLGDLVLDVGLRQLLRNGKEVRLSPKAFDFLALLVRERPRVVTKPELHERIWAGVFVSDASIAMVASEVRAALGESAREPKRIRTSHGHGYAFQGDVRPSDLDAPSHWLIAGDRVFPLHQGDNIVGREPDVDVRIDSPSVSRRHARLRITGADITVEDLGSTNGTFVGPRKISDVAAVKNGDEIRFGSIVAVCQRSADPTVPLS